MAGSDKPQIYLLTPPEFDLSTFRDQLAAVLDAHDGVHLVDGSRSVRKARGALGKDAIIGAFCRASRHDGMNAAEAGANYVAFGPVGASALGDGTLAEGNLFAWWSAMIELPVVAEGNLDTSLAASLAPVTDFIGIGEEIWRQDDPAKALAGFVRALG